MFCTRKSSELPSLKGARSASTATLGRSGVGRRRERYCRVAKTQAERGGEGGGTKEGEDKAEKSVCRERLCLAAPDLFFDMCLFVCARAWQWISAIPDEEDQFGGRMEKS